MLKKVLSILLVSLLLFSFLSSTAVAAEQPGIFKSTITVTGDGGRFEIGFVTLDFKKDFLQKNMDPVVFEVEIAVKDGQAGIEIQPGMGDFAKKVHIRVDSYEGLLYDKDNNQLVFVDIRKQQIVVSHFSRYAFA